MGVKQREYLKQDANFLFWDSVTATADVDSAVFNWDVPGGCPEFDLFLKVAGLDSGDSVTILLKESDDNFSASDVTLEERLVITADGEWVIPINHNVNQLEYLKAHADVTVASGNDFTLTGYGVAKRYA